MPEVFPARENPAEQDGGVDGRDLRVPHALSGVDVGKVVKEAAMMRDFLPQEAKSGKYPLQRRASRKETALIGDAQSGQAEPGRRNAAHNAFVVGPHVAAILHHPSLRTGLLPEEKKIGALEIVQK